MNKHFINTNIGTKDINEKSKLSWSSNQVMKMQQLIMLKRQKKRRSGKSDVPSRKRTKMFDLVMEFVIMTYYSQYNNL